MREMTGVMTAINKPKGITSHDVVYRVRKITGEKRVGHAGTLDPMAEGVLVVGIGRGATKRLSKHVRAEKEYETVIRLDGTSDTLDAEGEVQAVSVREVPTQQEIDSALEQFVGLIDQVPPQFSAVKVKGKKAYELARAGETIELEPRKREVKKIDVLDYTWPELRLRITTGKGVYIRALARDIGELLKTGGYLTFLQRNRVGQYAVKDALDLDAFEKKVKHEGLESVGKVFSSY